MDIVGYNSTVHMTGGGTVTNLLSLTKIESIINTHQTTGNYLAEDLGTKEIVSIYKDAIEVIVFTPIYNSGVIAANDNNTISQGKGSETTEDSGPEDSGNLPESYTTGC